MDSPIVAGILVVLVLGAVGAVVLVPGLMPSFGSNPGSSQLAGRPTPTAPGASAVATFARPTASPPPAFLTYRVKAGDSLSSLARKFRTDERSLAWWNRGFYPSLDPEGPDYDPNTIRVGWQLNYLRGTKVDEENPPAPIGTPRETPR
jgi:hypothetical protein